MSSRWMITLQLQAGVVLLLLLLGASRVSSACLEDAVAPSQTFTVKIGYANWLSQELNVNVVRIILEELLGYHVQLDLVNQPDTFSLIKAGQMDAFFEMWDSTSDRYAIPLKDPSIGYYGPLGIQGRIGWYIPEFLVDANSDFTNWRSLRVPANMKYFAPSFMGNYTDVKTPSQLLQEQFQKVKDAYDGCDTPGDFAAENAAMEALLQAVTPLEGPSNTTEKGVFLSPALDAGWNNKDSQLIEGLGLNFDINYLPAPHEENLITQARNSYDAGKPFIMYFWTPHQLLDPRSGIRITKMQLEEADDRCSLDPLRPPCYYPADAVVNFVAASLEENAPRAYSFIKTFKYQSNEDQIVMLADVYYDGHSVEEASCRWIKANREYVNSLIPEEKPLEFAGYDSVAGILVMVFAALFALVTVLFLFFINLNAAHPVILAANLVYCNIILIGSLFAYVAVFVFVGLPSMMTCVLQPLFLSFGFVFMYCSLILKNFRIWRIFTNPFQPHLTNTRLALAEAAFMAIIMIILVIWFLVDPPAPTRVDNGLTIRVFCQSKDVTFGNGMGWALFALDALLLILGALVAFKTRRVTSEFNESRFIGFAVYNVIIIGVVVVPLVVIPEIASSDAKFAILCFGIIFSTAFTVGTLFIPKIFNIIRGSKSASAHHSGGGGTSAGRSQLSGNGAEAAKLEDGNMFRYSKASKWPGEEKGGDRKRDSKGGKEDQITKQVSQVMEDGADNESVAVKKDVEMDLLEDSLGQMRTGKYQEAY